MVREDPNSNADSRVTLKATEATLRADSSNKFNRDSSSSSLVIIHLREIIVDLGE